VIGEVGVHFEDIVFPHMTTDAVFLSHRTSRARMVLCRLGRCREYVAVQAVLVVSPVGHQRLMRIMTSYAGDSRVAIRSPAATGFEAIRGKSGGKNTVYTHLNYVEAGAMAGAAKVN